MEVRKLRAKMIIETQSVMSSSEKNDESEFPPYLEVLQAESSGFETAAPSELSELRAEMKTEVVEIRSQMDAMALEMREIKTMMRQLVPRANARTRLLEIASERSSHGSVAASTREKGGKSPSPSAAKP